MENLKNIQPVEDFNWDAFEQGDPEHGKRQRSGYGYRYFYEQT